MFSTNASTSHAEGGRERGGERGRGWGKGGRLGGTESQGTKVFRIIDAMKTSQRLVIALKLIAFLCARMDEQKRKGKRNKSPVSTPALAAY